MPGIHVVTANQLHKDVDGRSKPGPDDTAHIT